MIMTVGSREFSPGAALGDGHRESTASGRPQKQWPWLQEQSGGVAAGAVALE